MGFATLFFMAWGCSTPCQQVQQNHLRSTDQTVVLGEGSTSDEHFALTVTFDALNTIVDRVLSVALNDALEIATSVPITSSRALNVRTDGQLAKVFLAADDACEHCFRIEAQLSGEVSVDLPMLGTQTVPLGGSMRLIAPVTLKGLPEGGTAVQLDLAQVGQFARSSLTAELERFPQTWSQALRTPLSQTLLAHLSAKLPPVTLFQFQPFDLGIDGLRVTPTRLKTDAESKHLSVAFSTNLPAPNTSQLPTNETLQQGEHWAVTVFPDVIVPLVRLLSQSNQIPTRYTPNGKASKTGTLHILLTRMVRAVAGSNTALGAANLPLKLDLQLWNFGDDTTCFDASAVALCRLVIENQNLEVYLDDFRITETSLGSPWLTDLVGLTQTDLLQRSVGLLKASLSEASVHFPASVGTTKFEALRLIPHPNAITVSGKTLFP